jgi:hypothetical protein
VKQYAVHKWSRVRFGFIGYRDHDDGVTPASAVVLILDLCSRVDEFQSFVERLVPAGGGDYPEAVLDGLNQTRKMCWNPSSSKKVSL